MKNEPVHLADSQGVNIHSLVFFVGFVELRVVEAEFGMNLLSSKALRHVVD